MAKYRNIKTGEVIEKLTKQDALGYFKEKDKTITYLHIKSVVVLTENEAIADKAITESDRLLSINKTREDGKRE